jgi:hypothetical protein
LLILPALALAIGCESKAEAPTAEPVSENSEVESEPTTPSAAEPTPPVVPVASEVVAPAADPVADAIPSESLDVKKPSPAKADPKESASEPLVTGTPRRGPASSGDGFNVWLEGKSHYPANQAATVTVVLTAVEPFKCNDQYPYKFTVAPNPTLGVPDAPVKNMSVSHQRSTMSIPIRPTAAGSYTLSGELSFSVCTDDKCLIEKKSISLPFEVTGS